MHEHELMRRLVILRCDSHDASCGAGEKDIIIVLPPPKLLHDHEKVLESFNTFRWEVSPTGYVTWTLVLHYKGT